MNPFPRGSSWQPGDHVSSSSAFGWDRCSAAWWFDRVLHLPTFDRSFFLIGNELHKVQELQFTRKRDKIEPASMTEIAAMIRTDLEVRFAVPGVKFATGETPEICIEDAICMAELWHKEVFPKVEPQAIELPIGPDDGLRLPGTGTPVKAVLDTIDQYAGIRDLKTAKAKWPEGAAEKKLPTQIYSWAFRCLYGSPPAYVTYDLLVRKKRGKKRTKPEAEYFEIKVIPDPVLEFGALRRFEAIVAQMKAGQYWPNHSHECDDCSYTEFCNQHFTEAPFAPWTKQAAETQVVEGPKLIRRGGRNGNSGDGADGDPAARGVTSVAVQAIGGRDGNGGGEGAGGAGA
jgi:hypothetical protein